jgi:hypothetical protein
MVGFSHRACVQKGVGEWCPRPFFCGYGFLGFFMIPGILELTSITPYIWGFAGGGLFSTLFSSAYLN